MGLINNLGSMDKKNQETVNSLVENLKNPENAETNEAIRNLLRDKEMGKRFMDF